MNVFVSDRVENFVGKRKNAGHQFFFPFGRVKWFELDNRFISQDNGCFYQTTHFNNHNV